ncbi:MAG: prepilin peptidase [Deltaproteobacteria bacterium]|nr:prepilin peptidase [Deltaproteobacteria bacterium]
MFAFIWGAIWGSFSNVVIYRLPAGKNIAWPPSHCYSCKHNLGAIDNIPILSYIFLLGKCRHCGASFSSRYAVIELISGIISLGIFLLYRTLPFQNFLTSFAVTFTFFQTLIILSFIDWDTFILPDLLVFPLILLGISWGFYTRGLTMTLVGLFSGSGLFIMITLYYRYIRKKEGLGLGDAKLLAAIGAFGGPFIIFPVILLASIQGLIFAALAFIFRISWPDPGIYVGITDSENDEFDEVIDNKGKWTLKPLPFGPFLSISTIEAVLLSTSLLVPFLNFFNIPTA